MGVAHRVGTLTPWDTDGRANYGKRITRADDAVDELISRIESPRDQGGGFKVQRRGDKLTKKLQKSEVRGATLPRVRNAHLNEWVRVISLKSGFQWYIKKLEFDPVIQTVGNRWIDDIFGFVFIECKDLSPEHYGICNRRNIGGLSIPSQHCPWEDPGDAGGPGSNAVDLGTNPLTKAKGDALAARLVNQNRDALGKLLWWGRAWEDGVWRTVPGIGHFDHLHAEGLHERRSLWSLVRSSC